MNLTEKDRNRFWAKVDIRGEAECWPWTAARDPNGYGRFSVRNPDRMEVASRVAFAIAHEDPGARHVLHECDNPPCVNPNHLRVGTHTDNMRDMAMKGRAWKAKLTDAQVIEMRSRAAAGADPRSLAATYRVSVSNVRMILRGETWRHLLVELADLARLLGGTPKTECDCPVDHTP